MTIHPKMIFLALAVLCLASCAESEAERLSGQLEVVVVDPFGLALPDVTISVDQQAARVVGRRIMFEPVDIDFAINVGTRGQCPVPRILGRVQFDIRPRVKTIVARSHCETGGRRVVGAVGRQIPAGAPVRIIIENVFQPEGTVREVEVAGNGAFAFESAAVGLNSAYLVQGNRVLGTEMVSVHQADRTQDLGTLAFR